jgi:hypothetical protein
MHVGRSSWTLELPEGSEVLEEENNIDSILLPNDYGVLQFSSFVKDGSVAFEELLEFSEDKSPEKKMVTTGDFSGVYLEYVEGEDVTKAWYLRKGSTMLFATYICDRSTLGAEHSALTTILSKLSYLG